MWLTRQLYDNSRIVFDFFILMYKPEHCVDPWRNLKLTGGSHSMQYFGVPPENNLLEKIHRYHLYLLCVPHSKLVNTWTSTKKGTNFILQGDYTASNKRNISVFAVFFLLVHPPLNSFRISLSMYTGLDAPGPDNWLRRTYRRHRNVLLLMINAKWEISI